jgi:hypothetical protein
VSTIVTLLIYAAVAGAAYVAFDHYILGPAEERGAANQLAKDQPVLEGVKTERDAAKKQATDALADVESCKSNVKTQNDLVDLWQSRAKENAAAAAKARAAGQAEHATSQSEIQRLQQIAAAPPVKDQTCQQKLDATDKLLRDAARARASAKK